MTNRDFDHFVSAQRDTFERALAEVRQGVKRSHWMWFIFPQVAGLGHSAMSCRYALSGLAEARAYLANPSLGTRLREITSALNDLPHRDADAVFGNIDAMKLRSSLTLFARAENKRGGIFSQTLDSWFNGDEDEATLALLHRRS